MEAKIITPKKSPGLPTKPKKIWKVTPYPRGILQVLSDGDDRMEAKIITPKNPQGFQQNPKKSLDQKSTPKKSHAKFPKISKKD